MASQFYNKVSSSSPILWWSLHSLSGSQFQNFGTGGTGLAGQFSIATSSLFMLMTGSASLSNPAYNAVVPFSSAFYMGVTSAAPYAVWTASGSLLNFMSPFDTGSNSGGFTVEVLFKYPAYLYPAGIPLWGWTDRDTSPAYGVSAFFQPVNYIFAPQCVGCGVSFISATVNYSYDQYLTISSSQMFSVNDTLWHHLITTVCYYPSVLSAPIVAHMLDGQGSGIGGTVGTWIAVSGTNPTGTYIPNYPTGMRFLVGSSYLYNHGFYGNQQVLIGEIAVYNRLLSADECQSHFLALRPQILSGTTIVSTPIYTVPFVTRDIFVTTSGTGGGVNPRATKTNPGAN